jgi:hypothetical protein
MSGILYPMLGALATTTYAVSLFAELYGLGFLRMAVQFADSGLTPDGASGSRRGVSPWLLLAAMPSTLVGVTMYAGTPTTMNAGTGVGHTFGVSNANLGLIWHTHLMVFACVAYRMFCNMGCWEANMATTLVIPTVARGEFARMMRMLVRFLFRGAGIVNPPKPEPNPDEKKPKPLPWWWWISLIFAMSARLIMFGKIPSLDGCSETRRRTSRSLTLILQFDATLRHRRDSSVDVRAGDANERARIVRALYLIGLMEKCEAITVVRYDDGSFFIFFQPNAGIGALTNFWPAAPRSEAELGQIGGLDLAHPHFMNQIPAYATTDDATTGALDANREGSWRRNQLRLEAGVKVPNRQDQI